MAIDVTSQPITRAPRLRVVANGNVIVGVKSIEVTSNAHYSSDRAAGVVALRADRAFGMAWWDKQSDITAEIQMALQGPGDLNPSWVPVSTIAIDSLDFSMADQCVRFDGRDLTSRFIDARTQESFANQTSSQIAKTLAERHGITASVASTNTLVGVYYNNEHDKLTMDNLSHQTTEWDLLTYLAQQENFDLWVKGNTLYFQPVESDKSSPYHISFNQGGGYSAPTMNAVDVSLRRSLTLAKDIQVTVKSTNIRTGTAYVRTVRATGAKSSSASKSNTQSYVITKAGLTPDEALKLAQQKLSELSKHERVIQIRMPGELALTPRNKIQLTGTGTGFDLTYFIDEISRSLSGSGFSEIIRAKNTSPKNQTTVL